MLKDDAIASILNNRISRATGYYSNNMSAENISVLEYYDGKKPGRWNKGSSSYTSNDVFDSIESITAQMLETFCGNAQPVKFMPQGPDDIREATIATEAVNFVVDRQNPGFEIKEAVIKDALMTRMGVAKVWWEKNETEEELQYEAEDTTDPLASGASLAAFMAQHPDAEPSSVDMDETTGAIKSATLKNKVDSSQVRIMGIPHEEFGITAGARTFEDADLLFHRKDMTPSEMIALGYPKDIVKGLPSGRDWMNDDLKFVRAASTDENPYLFEDDEQKAGTQIEVYECYTKLDVEEEDSTLSNKVSRVLWKVVIAGGTLLEKEKVKRQPFVSYVPLPRQHTVWGTNFGARLIPTQNSRTALTRSIIDHARITVNPRIQVARGGLMNPNELMDNRIGGIVNVKNLESLAPIPQAGLNPFVFQTISLLDSDKEELSGVSKLSQGLNKDALSQQNSAVMVEQLVSMSQIRQKVMARRFAEGFMKPLYMEVYQLLLENADKAFFLEVSGDWIQVDPSALKVRKDISVDFSLGYGEQQKEGLKELGIFQSIQQIASTDPKLGLAFTAENKFNIISRALKAAGKKDVATYISDPKTLPPPQPDPMHQLQQQKMQADVNMQNAQAQASMAKIQREAQRDQMQHQIEMTKLQIEMSKIQAQLQLDIRKQQHIEIDDAATIRMAQQELEAGKAQAMIQAKV